ncbi:hypothetical protein SLE2022_120900 [Rubroshorea leprosula]
MLASQTAASLGVEILRLDMKNELISISVTSGSPDPRFMDAGIRARIITRIPGLPSLIPIETFSVKLLYS